MAEIHERAVTDMLMGTFNHSLDAKGRMIIPARIREELGEDFVITKSPDHCLALYPKEGWESFCARLAQLPKVTSEAARRLRRFYFGNSDRPEPDKQGRILIPANLRDYAGLKKDITLIGVDDHAEIWDTESWESYNADTDAGELMYEMNGIEI